MISVQEKHRDGWAAGARGSYPTLGPPGPPGPGREGLRVGSTDAKMRRGYSQL